MLPLKILFFKKKINCKTRKCCFCTALIPQIIVVFPIFTNAEPSAVDMDPEIKGKYRMCSQNIPLGLEISKSGFKTSSSSYQCSVLWFWIQTAPVHQVDSFLSGSETITDWVFTWNLFMWKFNLLNQKIDDNHELNMEHFTNQKASVILQRFRNPIGKMETT